MDTARTPFAPGGGSQTGSWGAAWTAAHRTARRCDADKQDMGRGCNHRPGTVAIGAAQRHASCSAR